MEKEGDTSEKEATNLDGTGLTVLGGTKGKREGDTIR